MRLQRPGTNEGHRSMISNFNVIKRFSQKGSKKGDVDDDKQIDSFKNPYKKNEEIGNLRNEINCGGIGTFK